MWENLLEKTTLTISFTYSHDKCEQNKYNINRHHEITKYIWWKKWNKIYWYDRYRLVAHTYVHTGTYQVRKKLSLSQNF